MTRVGSSPGAIFGTAIPPVAYSVKFVDAHPILAITVTRLPIPATAEEHRQAFARFFAGLAEREQHPFDLYVTLTPASRSPWSWASPAQLERFGLPEWPIPLDRRRLIHVARRLMLDWDARVSRALCGSRFTKKPDERPFGIAMLELEPYAGQLPHWHCQMGVLPEHRDRFAQVAEAAWGRIAPGGTCVIKPIACTPERLAGYNLKERDLLPDPDRMMFLNGYLPV